MVFYSKTEKADYLSWRMKRMLCVVAVARQPVGYKLPRFGAWEISPLPDFLALFLVNPMRDRYLLQTPERYLLLVILQAEIRDRHKMAVAAEIPKLWV